MAHFIIQSRFASPVRIAQLSRDLGYPAYCPTVTWQSSSKWTKNPKPSQLALFPGYFFLKVFASYSVTSPPPLRPIILASGDKASIRYLKFKDTLATISDLELSEVKETEREVNYELNEVPPPPVRYKAGDIVKITEGVLQGRFAKVLDPRSKSVLITLLQAVGDKNNLELKLQREALSHVTSPLPSSEERS